MKTILITGSSSGIGKETAKIFAERGWRVIATMRDMSKAKDLLRLPNVEIMPLDLMDPQLIRETSKKALEKYDIDVLFNNAGYGIMATLERLPEQAIRDVFDANVIGTMLVTQQFIPHFQAKKSGMILVTTSLAGIIALPRDGAYGAAKHALQCMAESLYYELKPFGVPVKSIIPGGTKTNFQTPLNDRSNWEKPAYNQYLYLLDGNKEFPGPQEAAHTVWEAVHDGKDQINYPADSVCRKLYEQYQNMGLEKFKEYFSKLIFAE